MSDLERDLLKRNMWLKVLYLLLTYGLSGFILYAIFIHGASAWWVLLIILMM